MPSQPLKVFATLTGEYQNVGDGVIRRIALDWVRDAGSVCAYLGGAPDDWVEQMRLNPTDLVIRDGVRGVFHWLWQIAVSSRKPILLTEPGEMSLSRYNLPRQLAILIAAIIVRAKDGVVILPPRAVTRRPEALPWGPTVWIHQRISKMAAISLWRDEWSLEQIGSGEIAPDTAFGGELIRAEDPANRRTMFVSMRGARPFPSEAWLSAVREASECLNLRIVVAAQVQEDDARARAISAQLGGDYIPWETGGFAREKQLGAVYSRTALAIADRLHVLILASMSGAVPAELVAHPTEKVSSHFATIGLDAVSMDAAAHTKDEMRSWLVNQHGRASETRSAIDEANSRLRTVGVRIGEIFG